MKALILLCCLLATFRLISQNEVEKTFYLIPGQGSDGRLFKNLQLAGVDTQHIHYVVPEKGETMRSYSNRLSAQIDTTAPYSLLGVSLGGMVAVEMSKILQPEEVVLIASAKSKNEIPGLYKFFKKMPVHRVLGGNFYKFWTILLQPVYEPMAKDDQRLWRNMMRQKNPKFMKRAVRCIIEWENEETPTPNLLHIHGTKDRTLPVKNIHGAVLVENGTHVMTLTNGVEISQIINAWLVAERNK